MTSLYNCKSLPPDQGFRIAKFDADFNCEASYETTNATCTCPAGVRPTCRHRKMLLEFYRTNRVDAPWFLDFDTLEWHRDPLAVEFEAIVVAPEPKPFDPATLRRRV